MYGMVKYVWYLEHKPIKLDTLVDFLILNLKKTFKINMQYS